MEVTLSATSLLPSMLAIIVALATRQVLPAMFAGIWVGAWMIQGVAIDTLFYSLFLAVDTYILEALVPKDGKSEHMAIVLFSLMTGGMIGIISRNGGMEGIVQYLMRVANTRRKGQFATLGMGGLIFFDDYANTLIVGNTMRPLTDRLGISRQKLAFLVDSTAAPIACIAVVTTWVGFQVSLLKDNLNELAPDMNGFELVIATIPYSFYPIFMLWFIFVLIVSGRDFGAMRKAESDIQHHSLQADSISKSDYMPHAAKPLAINALLPIMCYIGGTLWGLVNTGEGDTIRGIVGSADPFIAILWGATIGLSSAVMLSIITRRMSLSQTMEALEAGLQPMLLAVMVLTLAWAIADINTDLNTANYIVAMIGNDVASMWLPALIFVVAAITSFATGSSWGSMGILVPLVLPLGYGILQQEGVIEPLAHPIMLATIASVLTGAVWGDHCSPISDTTILSSMASGCDHVDHVRTQMPYAMIVAGVSMMCGLLPTGLGIPWWGGAVIGCLIITLIIYRIGKPQSK